MNKKKILFLLFILVAIVQLFVPAKMILDREDVLKTGKEYKFNVEPIDPSDPFRGKYITLRFKDTKFDNYTDNKWIRNETVYVIFKLDKKGFAIIDSVSREKPIGTEDYLKTKIKYYNNVKYLFNRFYMEESKAYTAEVLYKESRRDTSKVTYALVNIKNGKAVLKNVLINGVSIRELVKERQLKESQKK